MHFSLASFPGPEDGVLYKAGDVVRVRDDAEVAEVRDMDVHIEGRPTWGDGGSIVYSAWIGDADNAFDIQQDELVGQPIQRGATTVYRFDGAAYAVSVNPVTRERRLERTYSP